MLNFLSCSHLRAAQFVSWSWWYADARGRHNSSVLEVVAQIKYTHFHHLLPVDEVNPTTSTHERSRWIPLPWQSKMGNDAIRLAASSTLSSLLPKVLERNISQTYNYRHQNIGKRDKGCCIRNEEQVLRNPTLHMEASHLAPQPHLNWMDTGCRSHTFLEQSKWRSRGQLLLPY